MINNEAITIQDCLDMQQMKGQEAVINAGVVAGFTQGIKKSHDLGKGHGSQEKILHIVHNIAQL